MEGQTKADQTSEPKLALPGAGISKLEMLFLNQVVKPFVMKRMDLKKALLKLSEGRDKVSELIHAFKQEDLTKRVLIKRPYFVEDSSRYWSAAMLCNHLGKVNGALAKAIESGFTATFGPDFVPEDRLRAVKPDPEKNDIREIEKFLQTVERIRAASERESEESLGGRLIPHPWFGDLTHLQWIWFAGFHMQVHARQLKQIVIGLP